MAGIFDRLSPAAEDRIPAHLFEAAYIFNAKGTFTSQQILDALNAKLASPLAGAELTDMSAIATAMSGQSGQTNKIVYALTLASAAIAVESGVMNEATFRSVLGIS